ncbi:putative mitochondrial carrier domain superfamily [Helianthus annuus]|nr:putative mitochondrial carrier domain superfamily [Helianthus annuus]KAJ0777909.1 putative mitochondrial carrier domain superfamily [Helianthus annuus]KAJ0786919.1 putative mitochondrial carrier domain superfamily [Helianthus annuus]
MVQIDFWFRFSFYISSYTGLDKTKFYVTGAGIFTGLMVGLYPISVVRLVCRVIESRSIPGLYRRFGTVITGAIPARVIFMTALETSKVAAFNIVEPFKLSEPTKAAIANGIAGMAASLCSQGVFVPIDVISQRLMVQGYSGHASYNGGLDVAQGFGVSVMTYSPSSAVCMLGHGNDGNGSIPIQGTIVMVQGAGGISAAAAASLITTPLYTIKTQLQVHLIFSLNIAIETITI